MRTDYNTGFNIGMGGLTMLVPKNLPQFTVYDLYAGFNAAKFRMSLPEGWLV